jgi:MFS family permease
LLYLLAVQSAVQIAGPYFNPYMLQQLRFAYWQYVVLVAAAYVTRIAALPALGRFAHRFGAKRLLWVGGVGIAPLSAAWLVSNTFGYLLVLQLTVGVAWAAYELSMVLVFFEAVPEDERTSMLTIFNVANALATVSGSLLGGAALIAFGKEPATYLALFAISSVARFGALVFLPRGSAEPAPILPPVFVRLPAPGQPDTPRSEAGRGIAA